MRMNGPLKKSRNAAFQELNPSGNYDNMSSEELEALIGGLKEEMKRKELLSNYPITQLSNGKWYIRLEDGKKIERANRSDVVLFAPEPGQRTKSCMTNSYLVHRLTKSR